MYNLGEMQREESKKKKGGGVYARLREQYLHKLLSVFQYQYQKKT